MPSTELISPPIWHGNAFSKLSEETSNRFKSCLDFIFKKDILINEKEKFLSFIFRVFYHTKINEFDENILNFLYDAYLVPNIEENLKNILYDSTKKIFLEFCFKSEDLFIYQMHLQDEISNRFGEIQFFPTEEQKSCYELEGCSKYQWYQGIINYKFDDAWLFSFNEKVIVKYTFDKLRNSYKLSEEQIDNFGLNFSKLCKENVEYAKRFPTDTLDQIRLFEALSHDSTINFMKELAFVTVNKRLYDILFSSKLVSFGMVVDIIQEDFAASLVGKKDLSAFQLRTLLEESWIKIKACTADESKLKVFCENYLRFKNKSVTLEEVCCDLFWNIEEKNISIDLLEYFSDHYLNGKVNSTLDLINSFYEIKDFYAKYAMLPESFFIDLQEVNYFEFLFKHLHILSMTEGSAMISALDKYIEKHFEDPKSDITVNIREKFLQLLQNSTFKRSEELRAEFYKLITNVKMEQKNNLTEDIYTSNFRESVNYFKTNDSWVIFKNGKECLILSYGNIFPTFDFGSHEYFMSNEIKNLILTLVKTKTPYLSENERRNYIVNAVQRKIKDRFPADNVRHTLIDTTPINTNLITRQDVQFISVPISETNLNLDYIKSGWLILNKRQPRERALDVGLVRAVDANFFSINDIWENSIFPTDNQKNLLCSSEFGDEIYSLVKSKSSVDLQDIKDICKNFIFNKQNFNDKKYIVLQNDCWQIMMNDSVIASVNISTFDLASFSENLKDYIKSKEFGNKLFQQWNYTTKELTEIANDLINSSNLEKKLTHSQEEAINKFSKKIQDLEKKFEEIKNNEQSKIEPTITFVKLPIEYWIIIDSIYNKSNIRLSDIIYNPQAEDYDILSSQEFGDQLLNEYKKDKNVDLVLVAKKLYKKSKFLQLIQSSIKKQFSPDQIVEQLTEQDKKELDEIKQQINPKIIKDSPKTTPEKLQERIEQNLIKNNILVNQANTLQQFIEEGAISEKDFPNLIKNGLDPKIIEEWHDKFVNPFTTPMKMNKYLGTVEEENVYRSIGLNDQKSSFNFWPTFTQDLESAAYQTGIEQMSTLVHSFIIDQTADYFSSSEQETLLHFLQSDFGKSLLLLCVGYGGTFAMNDLQHNSVIGKVLKECRVEGLSLPLQEVIAKVKSKLLPQAQRIMAEIPEEMENDEIDDESLETEDAIYARKV